MAASVSSEAGTSGIRLRIGDWRVDPTRNELARGAETVRLEPKVVEVLVRLAAKPGEVVSREDLLAAVWPGVVVGDDALTQAIIKLRKALGDDAHQPTYIETISKRGYRLIAPVEATTSGARKGTVPFPWDRRIVLAAVAVLGLVGLVAAGLSGPWLRMPWPIAQDTRGAAGSVPIVAVLPFSNLSRDPSREYFSDGMTEDIITGLGRFSGLRVMSMIAVQEFKGKAASPEAIRAQLGARYIVKGSVRDTEGKLRVAVELSDAERGTQLWGERYEEEGREVFRIQDRITRSIVGALHVRLTNLELQRNFRKPTESLDAYDMVLRARNLNFSNDRRANREARSLLAKAQELAPDYGEVFVSMGMAEANRAFYGWVEDPEAALKRAEEHAKRALASADTSSHYRAHGLLAIVYSNIGLHDQALRHSEEALALNPSDAYSLIRRGASMLYSGRIDEAIAALDEAKRIQPNVGPGNGVTYLSAYYSAGRYAEGLAMADVLVTRFPSDVMLHAHRVALLAQLDRMDEARKAAGLVLRLNPGFEVRYFATRYGDLKYTAKLQEGLIKAGMR